MAFAEQAGWRIGMRAGRWAAPAVMLLGALALYLPVYADFANGAWRRDENAHALIVMAIAAGAAAARLGTQRFAPARNLLEQSLGFALLALGLFMAVIGSASENDFILSSSQFVVASGAVIALFGWNGARRLWFALALTLYLIIWPGWALDALTSPLKALVSHAVSETLYAFGLPVAHAGAVISAGPYQLLVADACSGLNSLIALTAVGAVYLYAAKHRNWRVNTLVIACLVPIAVFANIVRVGALVLITYFLGYDAGQGFLHDGAGFVMFGAALGLVFLVDAAGLALFARKNELSS